MDQLMIERQFSPTVAAAQEALKVEAVYGRIRTALLNSELPGPLKNLGMVYLVKDGLVCVDLHGSRLRMRYEHVWLKDGHPIARLGGRLRFTCVVADDKDGDELLQVIFDHLGNIRFGVGRQYSYSASSDPDELASFVRQASLQIANAVHAEMAVIE